jgi:hypothetical protein
MSLKNLVLILKKKNDKADYTKLIEDYSHEKPVDLSDYEVSQANSLYSFRDEIIEHILERGIMSFFTAGLLLEDTISRGATQVAIERVIQKFLDKMSIDQELIIVDPYFFASTPNANYPTFFCNIIEKYLPVIDNLIFVTNSHSNNLIKNDIKSGLLSLKSTLNIVYKVSNNYHDRYWISSNREKGMVMGTSLNGLGNKFALVDRLNTSDVRDIVADLLAESMI